MNRKEMVENGWIRKKEYWIKESKHYGTWLWNKKYEKKEVGNVTVRDHEVKDLFDENGMLIITKVKK